MWVLMSDWLPLFPLSQPLFPGIKLDLQIFEQRYLKLVKSCLREDSCFGICAIHTGAEVGGVSKVYQLGVDARIVDWQQLQNGLLGITVKGGERFSFKNAEVDPDGLLRGEARYLKAEEGHPIPDWASGLSEIYKELCLHPEVNQRLPELESLNSSGLGFGLAQILPMDLDERIHCLRTTDSLARLEFLAEHIQSLSES